MNFNILVAIGNFMFFFAALAAYAVLFTESDGGEHAIDSITLATPFLVVLPLNFLIGDLIASRKWLSAYKWLSLLAMICIAGEAVYIICNFSVVYKDCTWGWLPCHLINIGYSYYIYKHLN